MKSLKRMSLGELMDLRPNKFLLEEWMRIHKTKPYMRKARRNAVCFVCSKDLNNKYGLTCIKHKNHPSLKESEFSV